jgi:hypothetical protein
MTARHRRAGVAAILAATVLFTPAAVAAADPAPAAGAAAALAAGHPASPGEAAAPAARGQVPTEAQVAAAAEKNAAERRAKVAYFRDNPWSPLRGVARHAFPAAAGAGGTTAVVGSSPQADVRLDGPGVEPLQLRLTALPPESADGPARFRLDRLAPGGDVRVGGQAMGAGPREVPEETVVEVGPFALRPYVQGGDGIAIVFDSRRTTGDAFVPPAFFPFDPAWVFRAPLTRFPKPETMNIPTSLGRTKEYVRAGYFEIDAPGGPGLKIYAYQPKFIAQSPDALSILFTDATTGKETYATGRYLDLEAPQDGLYTIDFNRAYNPLCSYTSVYNCPIPPRENALPVAVRAGEKAYPGRAAH